MKALIGSVIVVFLGLPGVTSAGLPGGALDHFQVYNTTVNPAFRK